MNKANLITAIVLILIGGILLAGTLFDLDLTRIYQKLWPLLLIIPGILFLLRAFKSDNK